MRNWSSGEGEAYDASIAKVAEHSALTCVVKMCDNIHNISTWPSGTSNKAMQWRLSAMFLRTHLAHRYFIRPCGLWGNNMNINEIVANAIAVEGFGMAVNNIMIDNVIKST